MEKFLEACDEARKTAFSFKNPLIVHHYDADGIASGAVVVSAFLKEGRKFRRECIKKLDDEKIERYKKEKEIIFVDLGGGNERVNELQDVLIIDHHQTSGIKKHQINPLLYGIDGSDELSSSGTAYFVFRNDVELGIVGAVGDMQCPLIGANRKMLEEGVKSEKVIVEEDLRFYGRYSRPLVQFLSYSDDPYVPGISYREDRAFQLLDDLKIPIEKNGKTRAYADLDSMEKKKLISAIANLMIERGQISKVGELVGESYVFPSRPRNETYEANEFSTMLNACGRWGHAEVGISVCLGEKGSYEKARYLLQVHRKMLREGIEYATGNIQDLGDFFFLDGRKHISENIIGTVCGMAVQQSWKKPIIGIAKGENSTIKISSRATRRLVDEGVNLGKMLKESVAGIGGVGGGHKIAAGASIPKDKINEFLLNISRKPQKLD
jgi:single-stranded-DNA-specific exonuclease